MPETAPFIDEDQRSTGTQENQIRILVRVQITESQTRSQSGKEMFLDEVGAVTCHGYGVRWSRRSRQRIELQPRFSGHFRPAQVSFRDGLGGEGMQWGGVAFQGLGEFAHLRVLEPGGSRFGGKGLLELLKLLQLLAAFLYVALSNQNIAEAEVRRLVGGLEPNRGAKVRSGFLEIPQIGI